MSLLVSSTNLSVFYIFDLLNILHFLIELIVYLFPRAPSRVEPQDLYSLCVNDKEVHGRGWGSVIRPLFVSHYLVDDWVGFDVVWCCVLLFISLCDDYDDDDDDGDDDNDEEE